MDFQLITTNWITDKLNHINDPVETEFFEFMTVFFILFASPKISHEELVCEFHIVLIRDFGSNANKDF